MAKSVIHVSQVLEWADTYHKHAGKWPTEDSGRIVGAADNTWCGINQALRNGNRGLPGGWSLVRLLAAYRGKRLKALRSELTIEQILELADAYFEREGEWPTENSGPIVETAADTWSAISHALRHGSRGLPGGSSLTRLLAEQRGKRNPSAPPPLTAKQILSWADVHHKRTGTWPILRSGQIVGADQENWSGISRALSTGIRGLPGGSSLARLLAEYRGKRNRRAMPALTVKQILKWADAHRKQTGTWPTVRSVQIVGADQERWGAVNSALGKGSRGLPGGSSLAQLLAEHRGRRIQGALPPLSIGQILTWADAHYERTGKWPMLLSGPIIGAEHETWSAVDQSLSHGRRGLPGKSSLAKLLEEYGRQRNRSSRPEFTVKQILAWADAHHARTGQWPNQRSGPLADAEETWAAVDIALRNGIRGLPGGSSLGRLLHRRRGARPPAVRQRRKG